MYPSRLFPQIKKKKKTVTEKWTKDNLERQMFSKHIQTFKFISDQKNSNSDQTSLIHPSDQPKKEQGGRGREYPMVEGMWEK